LSIFISRAPQDLWAFCRPNRRFQLQKHRQLFIRMHKETLSVAATARKLIETHEHVGELKEKSRVNKKPPHGEV
jgi:hypothetical protein